MTTFALGQKDDGNQVQLKPKHQSICMRFSYLAKNLQILHWVVLRLRESPFSKEDFCNMYKIFKKFHQTNLSYHF